MHIEPVTEKEKASWPKDVIVPLKQPFIDERSEIQPLVDAVMKSCLLITSKQGTVRAKHYHKTDWHYCYVLSGRRAMDSLDLAVDVTSVLSRCAAGLVADDGAPRG